jgi:MFS family permease
MIHSLLPVFLFTTLHASAMTVGLIEGLGEGVSLLMKTVSGVWSDRLGNRKRLAVLGYGIGALSKPLFALAESVSCWAHGFSIASARGSAVRRAMPSSPTSHPPCRARCRLRPAPVSGHGGRLQWTAAGGVES